MRKPAIAIVCLILIRAGLNLVEPCLAAEKNRLIEDNWSGVYVGAEGGFGKGVSDWSAIANGAETSHGLDGGLWGLTVGYQHQWENVVLGLEGADDWTGLSGHAACPNPSYDCKSNIVGLESLGARVGIDDLLPVFPPVIS